VPLPLKLLRVPPETEISDATKSVEGPLRVKVIVAAWPGFKETTSAESAMVGGVVSAISGKNLKGVEIR
jgi:hypothetical protein